MSGGTSVSKMPVWVGLILYSGSKMEVGRRRGGWQVLVRMCVFGSGRLHSTRNACIDGGCICIVNCCMAVFSSNNSIQCDRRSP